MSSSTADVRLIIMLQLQKCILYINYIMFVAGLIGNILNILIFTNLKVFRNNRCAFHLIVESIANIVMLCQYFLPQLLTLIHEIDPIDLSVLYCKLKPAINQFCRLLIDSIVCFEAVDQFLSTNHRLSLRPMSTLKLARCSIFSATILWFLKTIPFLIFYDIIPPSGCIITSHVLKDYYNFVYYTFLHGFLPVFLSYLFSLLAYRNVRYVIRRQIPVEHRRLDRQLTAMIFVRVIVLLPYTICRIYNLNVNVSSEDIFPYAINQLISAIVGSLVIWINSINFYIFLAASSRFRRQVKYFLIKKCWHLLKRWCNSNRNEVHPFDQTLSVSARKLE